MAHKNIISLILLLVVGFSIYAHILHAPPQIDDHDLLFQNPLIKDLAEFPRHWQDQRQKALTLFTFAINYAIGQENTFGYHLVNVVLHILTASLLYFFLLTLRSIGHWFALFAALLFLVHPIQTESVSYIWQRSEVLSGFFYMAALLSYLKGRMQGNIAYYLLTGFLYVVGFFAKGTTVTLPLMIVLIEISFFQFERARLVFRRTWPYLIPGGAVLVALFNQFSARYLNYDMDQQYVLTQLRVFWKYVGLAFLPLHQNVDHDVYRSASLGDPATFISLLGLILLAVAVVWLFPRQRLMAVGIVWFIIYLLPTSLFLRDPMWEHRLYFAMAGFAIFLAAGICAVFSQTKIRAGLAVGLVFILCAFTVSRNMLWRSPVLLLEDSVQKSPRKARPHHMLGTAYLNENRMEKALEQFQISILLDPTYAEAHNNIGFILLQAGQSEKAANYLERAIALSDYLETPYINLGYIKLSQGNVPAAENLFRKSLQFRETVEGYVGLGNLCLEKKEFEEARAAFLRAQKLSPKNPVVFQGLGNVYYYQNDYQNAAEMYNRAIVLDPSFAELSRPWMEKVNPQ